jgi:O-antigen/teichoic acid export membrane protein
MPPVAARNAERVGRSVAWRSLATDVAIYGSAYAVANGVAFLYIVVAGRTLSHDQFGLFNALFGLITVTGYFSVSVQLAATEAAALSQQRSALVGLMARMFRRAVPTIAFLTVAAIPLGAAIHAQPTEIALCGLAVFAMLISSTAMGFLPGLGWIRTQSGVTLVGAAMRLGVGWPLMWANWGVAGALWGYITGYTCVFIIAYAISLRVAAAPSSTNAARSQPLRLDHATVATFVLTFLPFGLDQLFVQAVAPLHGGDYAAVATASKLVFFCTYPLMAVAYSHLLAEQDETRRLRLLAAAAVALLVGGGSLASVLSAFPETSVRLFFGEKFRDAASYLGQMAFATTCFSLSTLGAHALIVWKQRRGYVPSLIAFGFGTSVFVLRHDSLATLVQNQVFVYVFQASLMLLYIASTIMRSQRSGSSR